MLTWVNCDLIYTYPGFSFLIRNMEEIYCRKKQKMTQIAYNPSIWRRPQFDILFFLLGSIAIVVSIQITQLCIY